MFVPKGHVSLTAAVDAVGKRMFGEDVWIGSDDYDDLRRKLHDAGDPAQRQELVDRLNVANKQWQQIIEAMRTDFVGSPPSYKDAVPVILISDRGYTHDVPPREWMNGKSAMEMFASGRGAFYPPPSHAAWSPEPRQLRGRLVLSEKSLRLLLDPLDSENPGDAQRDDVTANDGRPFNLGPTAQEQSTPGGPATRPPGVSDSQWARYQAAQKRLPNYRNKPHGVTEAAKLVAAHDEGDKEKSESVRRDQGPQRA
jgi:hypothetical protein